MTREFVVSADVFHSWLMTGVVTNASAIPFTAIEA